MVRYTHRQQVTRRLMRVYMNFSKVRKRHLARCRRKLRRRHRAFARQFGNLQPRPHHTMGWLSSLESLALDSEEDCDSSIGLSSEESISGDSLSGFLSDLHLSSSALDTSDSGGGREESDTTPQSTDFEPATDVSNASSWSPRQHIFDISPLSSSRSGSSARSESG